MAGNPGDFPSINIMCPSVPVGFGLTDFHHPAAIPFDHLTHLFRLDLFKVISFSPLKTNMEPKNHPIKKEHHLPKFPLGVPNTFSNQLKQNLCQYSSMVGKSPNIQWLATSRPMLTGTPILPNPREIGVQKFRTQGREKVIKLSSEGIFIESIIEQ